MLRMIEDEIAEKYNIKLWVLISGLQRLEEWSDIFAPDMALHVDAGSHLCRGIALDIHANVLDQFRVRIVGDHHLAGSIQRRYNAGQPTSGSEFQNTLALTEFIRVLV